MDIALSEQLWMSFSQPFFERRIDIAVFSFLLPKSTDAGPKGEI